MKRTLVPVVGLVGIQMLTMGLRSLFWGGTSMFWVLGVFAGMLVAIGLLMDATPRFGLGKAFGIAALPVVMASFGGFYGAGAAGFYALVYAMELRKRGRAPDWSRPLCPGCRSPRVDRLENDFFLCVDCGRMFEQ